MSAIRRALAVSLLILPAACAQPGEAVRPGTVFTLESLQSSVPVFPAATPVAEPSSALTPTNEPMSPSPTATPGRNTHSGSGGGSRPTPTPTPTPTPAPALVLTPIEGGLGTPAPAESAVVGP